MLSQTTNQEREIIAEGLENIAKKLIKIKAFRLSLPYLKQSKEQLEECYRESGYYYSGEDRDKIKDRIKIIENVIFNINSYEEIKSRPTYFMIDKDDPHLRAAEEIKAMGYGEEARMEYMSARLTSVPEPENQRKLVSLEKAIVEYSK